MTTTLPDAVALWRPPKHADAEALGEKRGTALLLALLAVAAVLRWVGIGRDLWLDEVFTLVGFVRLPLAQLLTDYSHDNQHLLFSLAAHLSVSLFGESAPSLRLPAVLFGLGSLWATWRLGLLVVGRREALLAVAFLVFSYHHVWFSQNARGYTGLLMATVLSTELLLRALWRGRWRLWIAYAASLAFGMGVHLTMIFVAAAHGLVVLVLVWRSRQAEPAGFLTGGRWRPFAAFALGGVLTLGVYAGVLEQLFELYTRPGGGTTTAAVEWKNPLWLVNETLRGLGFGLAFGWIGLAGGVVLFGAGTWSYLRKASAATVVFVLPAVLGGVMLLALERNLWPRFFFNELGFAALFAIRGAVVLGEWAGRLTRIRTFRPHLGTLLAVMLVVASAATLPRNYRLPKQDFTGARDFVLTQKRPGDRIVAVDLAGEVYRSYYAAGRDDFSYASTLAELEAATATEGRTWVIYTLGGYIAAASPDLWEALESHFEEVRAFHGTLGGGTVVVLRKP